MNQLYFMLVIASLCTSGVNCRAYAKCKVKLEVSACYTNEPPENDTVMECHEAQVCHKEFNIAYVKLEPYSSAIVSDLLRTCCGPCVNSSENFSLKRISEMNENVMNKSHLVFPVLGRKYTEKLYGYHFIPLIRTPSVYYITYKKHNLMLELIISCLKMWPLVIICVLMVLIAGFICWLTETWSNCEEFPRTFLKGWFEGIWWAFISMTTVGYGDKAPRSLAARLFSLLWIFVGITTFSLVTAMLTSEIIKANASPPPTMQDANVGVIRNRIYESIIISSEGGILIDVHPENVTEGIHRLIKMLDGGDIDGFVLDRYTLMLFYNWFKDHPRYKKDIAYLRTKTRLTEVTHTDEYFYGILVKNFEDYAFLEDFMASNRDVINTCNSLFLNMYSRKVRVQQKKHSLFSTDGEMFVPTLITCFSIIALICIFGAWSEFRQKKMSGDKAQKTCGNVFLLNGM